MSSEHKFLFDEETEVDSNLKKMKEKRENQLQLS